MRTLLITLIIVIGLLAAAPAAAQEDNPPEPVDVSEECRRAVSGIAALHAELDRDVPKHLLNGDNPKTASDFDVSAYLTVLDQLAVEEGYVFDYVYNGAPLLYTAPEDSPITTFNEFHAAFEVEHPLYEYSPYIQAHMTLEDTPTGYLQMVVLYVMGEQFYLEWHANYNDWQIVCDTDMLEDVLEANTNVTFGNPVSAEEQKAAREIDLTPTVTLYEDVAEVRLVLFTKWGGFYEWTITFGREFPHGEFEYESESLVAYDCGFLF